VDFWDQHTVMFVIGLILWPRALLIYFGFIPPMSIPPILGMAFVPRMFLAGTLTPMYWATNPILIVICWILAIVVDVWGIIMKLKFQSEMFSNLQKNMSS
jgi:hypothetical protein